MERRKQILQLVSRFDKDFEASLAGLNNEDQLAITGFLKKVIPLFIKQEEGYYERFYATYEAEILEKLRSKAKKLHELRLTDYLVQNSMKLVDLQHDLKINNDDQMLNDSEYNSYMKKVSGIIHQKYQILLLSEADTAPTKRKKENRDAVKNDSFSLEVASDEATPLGNREELMSMNDCMKFLGISKPTLYSYIEQGLPRYQIGRTVKFKESEVLNFMRQNNKPVKKKK